MALPKARICASLKRRGWGEALGDTCGDEAGWMRGELMGRYLGVLEPAAGAGVGRKSGDEGSERTPVLLPELDRETLSKTPR